MGDRLRERVQGFVEQLLKEEKSSLRKAQTFLEIETLTVETGEMSWSVGLPGRIWANDPRR